ncbi:MAG: acyl-CoA dehydrogenase family protein [Gammaproteobacteria bacterium]
MNAITQERRFDAAAIAPVRAGTAELDALIAEIGASARASKAAGLNPFPAIDLVRASRLGALRIPAHDGGGGASIREFFSTLMQLAEADSDVAQILRAHFWFVEERLRGHDPVVRKRWLARVLAGEIFGNAMLETGSSTPVGQFVFQTVLTPEGDGYRLHGAKNFCTGSLFSDWVWVLASTPDGALASAFVPVDRAGVTLEDDWDGVGQRFTGSGSARFDNVRLNAEEVLHSPLDAESEEHSGRKLAEPYLTGQFVQLILTATIVGNLRKVVREAVRLVRTRKRTFTHASAPSTAADPQFQEIVGRLASQAAAAEALVLAAADAQQSAHDGRADFDRAHRASVLAAEAKVFVDDIAPRAATLLFELGGASQTVRAAGLDEPWRNMVTLAAHNPTAFKARAIGDWLVNGVELPINGYF